jgi:hypothetical protein
MEWFHRMDTVLRQQWMKFIMDHAEDIHMVQHAKHLLSVSQKTTRK